MVAVAAVARSSADRSGSTPAARRAAARASRRSVSVLAVDSAGMCNRSFAAGSDVSCPQSSLTEHLRSEKRTRTDDGDTLIVMRRSIPFLAVLTALLAPAAALAVQSATTDGTLVVKNGNAP